MAVVILAGAQSATAAVDWTPYLKGMQDHCSYDSKEFWQALGFGYPAGEPQKAKTPKALQASVSGYSVKEKKKLRNGDDHYLDIIIKLKNATAFGEPITKVHYYIGYEFYGLEVTFANNNFTRLKPRFTMTYDGKKYPVGSNKYWDEYLKIDKNGWIADLGEYPESLSFNAKDKSIKCSSFL